MVGVLRVGCPQWNHRSWSAHLPAGSAQGWSLRSYAGLCTAVEGNTTFYALPTASTVARWREEVPDDFRFCFKLPRQVSHDAALSGRPAELGEFLERIGPLAEVLGPTSIQLPASFGPEQLPTLAGFLGRLPGGWRWAVEVRHPAFFSDPYGPRLDDLLRSHSADRVILDSRCLFAGPATTPEEIEAHRRKPRLPVRPIRTGDRPVVRFIGQNDQAANPTFWNRWLIPVGDWLRAGHDPFVFIHTPDNVASPILARRFYEEIRALVPELAELPEPGGELPQQSLW